MVPVNKGTTDWMWKALYKVQPGRGSSAWMTEGIINRSGDMFLGTGPGFRYSRCGQRTSKVLLIEPDPGSQNQ